MNILQINAIDSRGGAAKVASRMLKEIQKTKHDAAMLVGHRAGGIDRAEEITYPPKFIARDRRYNLHGVRLPTTEAITAHEFFHNADLLHFHNLHMGRTSYFNISDLPALTAKKPSIWTLHDPWLIFERGKTPQYNHIFEKEPRWFTTIKRRAVRKSTTQIVTPSKWLAKLVKDAFPKKSVIVIPNGVDTTIFKPRNKQKMRQKLKLPKDKPIVLFIANEGEDNAPKGTQFIEQARKKLSAEGVHFVSLGSSRLGTYVSDEKDIAEYYAAADVFLLPSLAENLPLTILEAMACGTPAVAFDTGGVSEAITHSVDGYVAKYLDGDDIITGIRLVLKKHDTMSKKATARIAKDFSLSKVTAQYLDLYQSLTKA